ncbi:MAG TPA: hypothetical protein VFK85_12995 [Anaeromyxobacteraceae bacterium]|nr:hypothetical protein [Anaeromyxobacteraceae bacterium]
MGSPIAATVLLFAAALVTLLVPLSPRERFITREIGGRPRAPSSASRRRPAA